MSDEYRERMLAIVDQLRAQRVNPYTSAPPFYRLAWLLGLHIRPPLYQTFASLALCMGVSFGIAWGLMMWLLFWRSEGPSIIVAFVASLFAAVLFGLTMASYYRWKAARLRLPPLGADKGT
jgi:hypothetical protein